MSTTLGNGWTCPQCRMFVFYGVTHTCGMSFDQADLIAALNRSHAEQVVALEADRDHYKKLAGELQARLEQIEKADAGD